MLSPRLDESSNSPIFSFFCLKDFFLPISAKLTVESLPFSPRRNQSSTYCLKRIVKIIAAKVATSIGKNVIIVGSVFLFS